MIKLARDKARALLAFVSRAPVENPASQRIAIEAFDKIKDILTEEEQTIIMSEWKKIRSNEGSTSFDSKMKKILQRFWVS